MGDATFSPDAADPGGTPGSGGDPDGPGEPPGGDPRTPWWRRPALIIVVVVVVGTSSFGLYRWAGGDHRPEDEDAGATRSRRPAPTAAPGPETPATLIPPVSERPPTTPEPAPTTTVPPAPAIERPAPIGGTDYRLDFADDFDGTAPDPSVWVTAPFGDSLPATVSGGMMTLRTTEATDYKWAYIASTGPRREAEPNYTDPQAWEQGYFEARLRYTDDPWSWPAFWLFSMAKTEAWPEEDCTQLNAEWDIMENGLPHPNRAGDWYHTALHRNTSDGTDDAYCGQPDEFRQFTRNFSPVDLSDWHVWGAHWAPGTFCTYLDGVEIQCMEPYESTAQPMHLVFTMQYLPRCEGGCPPRPDHLEMQVDWVRVWQDA